MSNTLRNEHKKLNNFSCLTLEELLGYSNDNITSEKKKIIEEHIKECPLCSDAIEGISYSSGKKQINEMINSIHKDIHLQTIKFRQKNNDWKKYYAVAAILVLTFLSAFYLFNKKPINEILFSESFQPYPNITPIIRGESEYSQYQNAMVEYELNNFHSSLKILKEILAKNQGNLDAHFYSGICLLSTDNSRQAIYHFKNIINTNHKFAYHAEWYLGLAYLKANKIDEANIIFKKISQNEGIYKNESLNIIKKIKH